MAVPTKRNMLLAFLGGKITVFREHLGIPLFANAYALILSQVATSGLGFLYWIIAARLYPVDAVGENSVIVSTTLLIVNLAQLSMKGAMARFMPRVNKTAATRFILSTTAVNLTVALLIGGFLLTLGKNFPLTANLLDGIKISPVWLIPAAMAWVVFDVQDGLLTGMRQAKWVLFKNSSFSMVKIVLLVVFFKFFPSYGLAASWFVPAPFYVLAIFGVVFGWLLPRRNSVDWTYTKPLTRGEIYKSISGDHIGTIVAEVTVGLLPLLVLNAQGKEAAAYYYQAWVICAAFYVLASNMVSSFTVEASMDMDKIISHSRQILIQMARLLIPAVFLMIFAAPLVLYLFGENYAQEGTALLRWLIFSTIPFMFNNWYLGYCRVLSKVKNIIFMQSLLFLITLGAGYVLLPVFGIAGIGMAWLLGQVAVSIYVIYDVGPLFRSAEFISQPNDEHRAKSSRLR